MQTHGTHGANSSQQLSFSPMQRWPRAAVPTVRATFVLTQIFSNSCVNVDSHKNQSGS